MRPTPRLAILTLLAALPTPAQELPEMSPEAAASMNAWMELATPGEHHEHLARYAGRWSSEVTMWMEPGAEPMVNPAAAEARLILGGRYVEWFHSGIFGGMPFEARELNGFDNGSGKYQSTWSDNFGTLILYYTGECENDGNVRTMHGELLDPLTGGTISQRAVYTWTDDDNWLYESYMSQGGEEFKNMEIRYTRVN